VKDNPDWAVGITFAAALLIGILTGAGIVALCYRRKARKYADMAADVQESA
jgi:hypothetical protein